MNPLHYENGWPIFPNSRKSDETVHYSNVDLRSVYDGVKQLKISPTR